MRIHDLQDLKQMYAIVTLDDERSLDRIEWSDDGQLMAVSSPRGILHIYLTKLPIIGTVSQHLKQEYTINYVPSCTELLLDLHRQT